VDVTLSVRRSGSTVFSTTYADVQSFQDTERETAAYADQPHVRFASREWEPESGRYVIRYTYRGRTTDVPVPEIEDAESKNLGVEMTFLGGAYGPPRPSLGLVEFDSERQAREFLDTVEPEGDSA